MKIKSYKIFRFFKVICFILLIFFIGMNSFVDAETFNNYKVDELLKVKFFRVNGDEKGKAVLDRGNLFSWHNFSSTLPTVVFDGKVYRMWFAGQSKRVIFGRFRKSYGEKIGMAISQDGIHWDMVNQGKPVFDKGEKGAFDSKGVSHPFVLYINGKYMMWYGGFNEKKSWDIGMRGSCPAHVRVEQIGLATSLDGIHWKRENEGKPVLGIGNLESIDSVQATGMHVNYDGKEFIMWYGAYNGKHTLGIAKSLDGIHWEKIYQQRSLEGLQGDEQLGPSVYFDGEKYFMMYSMQLENNWTMVAAVSDDGFHWIPVNNGKPVLDLSSRKDFNSFKYGGASSVHPSQMIFFPSGRVRVWYGTEEGSKQSYQRTGLMEGVF